MKGSKQKLYLGLYSTLIINTPCLQIGVRIAAEAVVNETTDGSEGDPLQNLTEIATHDSVQRTQGYVQNHAPDQVMTQCASIKSISNTIPPFSDLTYQQSALDMPELLLNFHNNSETFPLPRAHVQE